MLSIRILLECLYRLCIFPDSAKWEVGADFELSCVCNIVRMNNSGNVCGSGTIPTVWLLVLVVGMYLVSIG